MGARNRNNYINYARQENVWSQPKVNPNSRLFRRPVIGFSHENMHVLSENF